MSLDAWEQRALNSIAASLTASAPEFASRLSVFNRLTSGEQMPEDLQARVKEQHGHGRHQGGRASLADSTQGNRGPIMRPSHGRVLPVIPMAAALALTIAVVITLALVLSATSHTSSGIHQGSHCAQGWPAPCSGR